MLTFPPLPPFREHAGEPRELSEAAARPDRQALLQARIKDLELHLKGTPLEKAIHQLYAELEAKGISLRPECYLSDQWGCPSDVPVIGIPFYLADPNLHLLEAELSGEAETDREILMYLRHEAGHAFNYAYKLHESEEWRRLFGDYSKPYRDDYKPQPFSRKYVVHIAGWYAQKHPDEDFAETFAVWLTPKSDWARRYQGWGAIKKLQYVEDVVARLGREEPLVKLADRDVDVDQMEETVADHYRQRILEERVELPVRDHLDQDLCGIFEAPAVGSAPAETLVRSERQAIVQAVTQYSGVSRPVVRTVMEQLLTRTVELGLTVHPDKAREYATKLTALVTALAMNYLYTDRLFEVD